MMRSFLSIAPAQIPRLLVVILLLACTANAFQSLHPIQGIHTPTTPNPFIKSRDAVSSPSHLYSLRKLIETVEKPAGSSIQQTIFVGGKGGVGKTTISSAIAVHLASTSDNRILIVSTDPAHSLGDALDVDLKRSGGAPVLMTDPLTQGRLYAQEVDAIAALDEFRENLAAFDVQRLAQALQVDPGLLESLGLSEFSSMLSNPPPGLDELVALSNVFDDKSTGSSFDIVVVDTAPTGHTLRLLQLPQFLDGLLGKLIKLRVKLSGITATLQAFLGNAEAGARQETMNDAVKRLENFQSKMGQLRANLANHESTRFVVVTVPTVLAVAESKRLVSELSEQKVSVTDIIVNQCVAATDDDATLHKYYERRMSGQQKWLAKLADLVQEVSQSKEFKSNGNPAPIALTNVPFFDVELVGIAALGYVGNQVFSSNDKFEHLLRLEQKDTMPRVVICGGKGGVGKTTTSASLAVTLAATGHKVALISTDPAHSLGDVVDMNLKGGKLQECPLIGVPGVSGEGSLSVLEIDPSSALSQFKGLVDNLIGIDSNDDTNAGLRNTLKDLQEVFDTLPAGTDEVVALAKLVKLVKEGGYDRIVLDTAPTGHTLRMLSTPSFLVELINRLLRISDKINSNSMVKMLISSSARRDDINSAVDQAKSTLLSFQLQMYDLEDLFANAEKTEFLIVTIPTELAVRESLRLLNDLTFEAPEMPIKVRNVIVNQVLDDDDNNARIFLDHISASQNASLKDLERYLLSQKNNRPTITTVPYLDTEPTGVFGLNALAKELLQEALKVETS